jgi:uncharacterized protein
MVDENGAGVMTGHVSHSGLSEHERNLIKEVLSRHKEVSGVILFGSRAKGIASPESDIDLALEGIDDPLKAEAIANELDDLPMPYRFDVKAFSAIKSPELLDHIRRVGVRL